jgi:hypothetical protein
MFFANIYIFFLFFFIKVMILVIIPEFVGLSSANYAKNLLRTTVLLQYVPRIIRFVPLLDGQSANGFIFESAWANFVINLLMFVLAGHVVGSCWYLFGLQVGYIFLLKCYTLDNSTWESSISYYCRCVPNTFVLLLNIYGSMSSCLNSMWSDYVFHLHVENM